MHPGQNARILINYLFHHNKRNALNWISTHCYFVFAQFPVLSLNKTQSWLDIVFDAKESWILNIRVASLGASFLTPFERKYWHRLQLRPCCKGHASLTTYAIRANNTRAIVRNLLCESQSKALISNNSNQIDQETQIPMKNLLDWIEHFENAYLTPILTVN